MTPATRRLAHLVRRWWGSLSSSAPAPVDVDWAHANLLVGERFVFDAMSIHDRRHAISVARRFVGLRPDSPRDDVAAALLHDVGKSRSDLSTTLRVLATVVGPRTRRFRDYHDHEAIGLDMCRRAGSTERTLSLLDGRGESDVIDALRRADDI
ncbi:MAG: hypothetical protein RL726_1669 [Actinomycetota bacterium]|jgi:hypothetical protein